MTNETKRQSKPSKPADHASSRSKSDARRSYAPFIFTFCVSMATWLVLSGRFDSFHLVLGALSCLIVSVFSSDMLFPSRRTRDLKRWLNFVRYVPWLLIQVFKANLHVMRLVFHPKMRSLIEPRIVRFRSRLRGEMSLFILANSITLTPGTITVSVNTFGTYSVHVIDRKSGDALPGEMENRVAAITGEDTSKRWKLSS